jgi:hypothetical protein
VKRIAMSFDRVPAKPNAREAAGRVRLARSDLAEIPPKRRTLVTMVQGTEVLPFAPIGSLIIGIACTFSCMPADTG